MNKLMMIFGALALSFSTFAKADNSKKSLMIDCKDQQGTTVQVFASSDGDLYGPPYTNNTDLAGALNPNVKVKIRHNGETYNYSKNILTVADGAGQVALQGFVTDGLDVFAEVFNFYFEHEGWYLVGDFKVPTKDYRGERNYRQAKLYSFSSQDKMTCDLPYL